MVHDYATALETLRASRFDLVLTDNRLGRKTGLDLARYLRNAEDSRLNALPIVLVTAELPYVDEDISETVQHFIEKPYDRQDLAQAIRLAINAGDPASAAVATTVHDQTETHDPAPPLLDTRVLNQLLTDLGVERCWRIVESYQKTAPRLFRALAQGSTADDLVAISEAAHQLISAASFVGLTGIATRARELHRCCIARDKKQVRKLNADLQHLGQPGLEALAEHWTRATESYNLPSRHSDPSGKPGQGKGLAAS
ncbi:MAG: response regulator [Maritimibacter sp.]